MNRNKRVFIHFFPLIVGVLLSFSILAQKTSNPLKRGKVPADIDLSKAWRFAPDEDNLGISDNWFAIDFDDSAWDTIDAGEAWELQGYPDLDATGWYRKSVDVPKKWKVILSG